MLFVLQCPLHKLADGFTGSDLAFEDAVDLHM